MSLGRAERFAAEQPKAVDEPFVLPPTTTTPTPIDAPPGTIGCCICLNQRSRRVAATTIVAGYAVCDDHVKLAGAPGFSIQKIRGESHAT